MASKGREVANIVSSKTGVAVTITGDPLILGVGNTERVRIYGNNRIGINTTSTNAQIDIGGVPDEGDNIIEYNVSAGASNGYAQLLFTTNATYAEKYLIAYQDGHSTQPNDLSLKNLGGDITFVASDGGLADAERLRITSSGNIGIGTDNPGKILDLQSSSALAVRFYNSGTFRAGIEVATAAGQMVGTSAVDDFCIRGQENILFSAGGNTEAARFNSSGNLVFPSGQGIDFSATANSSGSTGSELFNDYEEGTWTPGISFDGGTTGITYSEQTGVYRKIGNYVWCSIVVTLTNKGSSSGNAFITGLPFTVSNTTSARSYGAMSFYQNFAALNDAPSLYGLSNVTSARFTTFNTDGTQHIDMNQAYFTNTTQFRGFIEFTTD